MTDSTDTEERALKDVGEYVRRYARTPKEMKESVRISDDFIRWRDRVLSEAAKEKETVADNQYVYLISGDLASGKTELSRLMNADLVIMGHDLSVEGLEYWFGWADEKVIVVESLPNEAEANTAVIKEAIKTYSPWKSFRHIRITQ
jgi:hypothetical protein